VLVVHTAKIKHVATNGRQEIAKHL